jgi:hypothetical protein
MQPGGKSFETALRKALGGRYGEGERLDVIAGILVVITVEGDLQAIFEVANSLDGKPTVQGDMAVEDKGYGQRLIEAVERYKAMRLQLLTDGTFYPDVPDSPDSNALPEILK